MLFASKTPQGFISLSIWLDLTVFSLSYLNQKLIPIRQKTVRQNGECQFSNKVLESGCGFSKRQSTIIAGGSPFFPAKLHCMMISLKVWSLRASACLPTIIVLFYWATLRIFTGYFWLLTGESLWEPHLVLGMKPKLAVQGQCSSWYTITLLPSTEVWHACWELWCS